MNAFRGSKEPLNEDVEDEKTQVFINISPPLPPVINRGMSRLITPPFCPRSSGPPYGGADDRVIPVLKKR